MQVKSVNALSGSLNLLKLGLIGGMSPESTLTYYRDINRQVNAALGGHHSAPILLESVDFETIVRCQESGDWAASGRILAQCARHLEHAGAQKLLLCTNTMHKVAPAIESAVGIELLHIVDATARAIEAAGMQRVALLGTRFTMQDGFYHERMARFGVELLTPPPAMQAQMNEIIFSQLCQGQARPESKAFFLTCIQRLQEAGAQGVIFGCTEINLLLGPADCALPVFDSTALHVAAAVKSCLSGFQAA